MNQEFFSKFFKTDWRLESVSSMKVRTSMNSFCRCSWRFDHVSRLSEWIVQSRKNTSSKFFANSLRRMSSLKENCWCLAPQIISRLFRQSNPTSELMSIAKTGFFAYFLTKKKIRHLILQCKCQGCAYAVKLVPSLIILITSFFSLEFQKVSSPRTHNCQKKQEFWTSRNFHGFIFLNFGALNCDRDAVKFQKTQRILRGKEFPSFGLCN